MMVFQDRAAAGATLAERLAPYKGADTVILALPRGGVAVAAPVAELLAALLDIIAVRKIGDPRSPEYAIGATDERGETLFSEGGHSGVDPIWLKKEIAREQKEAQRRAKLYRGGRTPIPLRGKTVIVVDDGIATGLTMRLAVRVIQAAGPARIIVAVPVASAEAVADIKAMGVEIVILDPPEDFAGAVGSHYVEFAQVSDAEVIETLKTITP